jgi:hypothetical protein
VTRARRRPRLGPARRNLHGEQVAASLQRTCRGWVVIWSAWRQAFTAFSAITPDALVIDETSAWRLLQRIGEIERATLARS